jgi:hypothetical protein
VTPYEKFAKKYYNQLRGYTVVDFNLKSDPYDNDIIFPTLTMTKAGKTIKVSVSQDEEGNGGGHLFIEEND